MKRVGAFTLVIIAAATVSAVRGGHELPDLPFVLSARDRDQDAGSRATPRRAARRQAPRLCRCGPGPCRCTGRPTSRDRIRSARSSSCGVNPQSSLAAASARGVRSHCSGRSRLGRTGGFHPASLPGHAISRRLSPSRRPRRRRQGALVERCGRRRAGLKVKASGGLARAIRIGRRRDADWDVEVVEVDAARSCRSATLALNGWIAPPWLRTGWFHAERLLADAASDPARQATGRSRSQRAS